jgi:hypothetical protein
VRHSVTASSRIQNHASGDISEDAWRWVERDLDLEELRMEA